MSFLRMNPSSWMRKQKNYFVTLAIATYVRNLSVKRQKKFEIINTSGLRGVQIIWSIAIFEMQPVTIVISNLENHNLSLSFFTICEDSMGIFSASAWGNLKIKKIKSNRSKHEALREFFQRWFALHWFFSIYGQLFGNIGQ